MIPKKKTKSTPSTKWLKIEVPTPVHTKLKSKAVEMGITIPEAVEIAIKRWNEED
jgi:hypothetical protein